MDQMDLQAHLESKEQMANLAQQVHLGLKVSMVVKMPKYVYFTGIIGWDEPSDILKTTVVGMG